MSEFRLQFSVTSSEFSFVTYVNKLFLENDNLILALGYLRGLCHSLSSVASLDLLNNDNMEDQSMLHNSHYHIVELVMIQFSQNQQLFVIDRPFSLNALSYHSNNHRSSRPIFFHEQSFEYHISESLKQFLRHNLNSQFS